MVLNSCGSERIALASPKRTKQETYDECECINITDTMTMEEVDDETMDLYTWMDHIPLSRPKRNMARDFSDAVLAAEVVYNFFPGMVELHNYQSYSRCDSKITNWKLLNRKVLRKLNIKLSEDVIINLANSRPGTIQRVLLILRSKIDRIIYEKQRSEKHRHQYGDRPEVDQHPTDHPEGEMSLSNPCPNDNPGNQDDSLSTPAQLTAKISASEEFTSDYTSRLAYEEKAQECLAKEETIEILNAEVRRLEYLVHLKDIRIEDLQCRLEGLRSTKKHH